MYNTAEKAFKDQVKLKNFGHMHFYLKAANLALASFAQWTEFWLSE